jgi:hypothetical protein
MNKIIIIGGGLTGLTCAVKLIQMELIPNNIEIFEGRQEIGSPTRSPGIAINSKNFENLFDIVKIQPLTLLNNKNNILTFRREWLEKSISIYLSNLGCKIHLKTKATEKNLKKYINENYKIINCAGKKRKTGGFPADYMDFIKIKDEIINHNYNEIINWYGYLSLDSQEIKFEDFLISVNKKDGLSEIWTTHPKNIDIPKNGWIEIIKSQYPNNSKDILANNTIDRGYLLANEAMK